jgi:tetratricopeptide (TPR) repeat protein
VIVESEAVPPQVVEALIDEAWEQHRLDRHRSGLAAADRAVGLAERSDDPTLLVGALVARGALLAALGEFAAALVDYTRVFSVAEDPVTARRLDPDRADWAIAKAYIFWPEAARFAGGVPVGRLFEVLDAAERWLAGTGHRDWRGGVLSERSYVYEWLGDLDAAIAAAEEALATFRPGSPGDTLGTVHWRLGDLLRRAGRREEAERRYQTILDDPSSSPYERMLAHMGMAHCALVGEDLPAARRHATRAVRLAEPMGDDPICPALEVMVAVCRAEGDLDGAWQAAQRRMEAAGRVGGHIRRYYALRDLVDVALDRGALDIARGLLGELEAHAAALDADRASTTFADEAARRRRRLDDLAHKPIGG